jgi:3D (Asp-Asp-Asp) domain-containing protein
MVVTSTTPVEARAASSGDVRHVRLTAYTHSEGGRGGHLNAHGARLHVGSAAADWSRFPYGTRFRVRGRSEVFMVDDYGAALVGTNTIDLYMPTHGSMNRWGVRHTDIELLEMGDFQKSREILKTRVRHSGYVRRMLHALEKR